MLVEEKKCNLVPLIFVLIAFIYLAITFPFYAFLIGFFVFKSDIDLDKWIKKIGMNKCLGLDSVLEGLNKERNKHKNKHQKSKKVEYDYMLEEIMREEELFKKQEEILIKEEQEKYKNELNENILLENQQNTEDDYSNLFKNNKKKSNNRITSYKINDYKINNYKINNYKTKRYGSINKKAKTDNSNSFNGGKSIWDNYETITDLLNK